MRNTNGVVGAEPPTTPFVNPSQEPTLGGEPRRSLAGGPTTGRLTKKGDL